MAQSRHERETLPIPDRPYAGPVYEDAKDPEAKFPPIEPLRPPAGAPNVLDHPARRRRLRRLERLRRPLRDADRRAARGERAQVQPLSHDGALLADAPGAPHRPEPPLGRNGRHHGDRHLGPGVQLDPPEHRGAAGRDAQAERLLDRAVRQVPRGAGVGDEPARARSTRGRPAAEASSTSTASSAERRTSTRPRSTTVRRPIEPDRTPEEGYHFTEDMTDRAIDWIRQQKALMPDKPFFVYFAPGATHAPHHVPPEWSDKYKGRFDDGWDALRERTLARQKELGIVPEDAELTERAAEIPAWDDMPDELKPVLARQMEVYAGFLEHTDHHIGRLIDALDDLGILDDTLVYYIIGDNGASAEGTPNGCFNELAILNGAFGLETVEFMASRIDDFGTPRAYNHYAVGWAHAMDAPYQWTKQIASHWGGTRNGTIVHWPAGIRAKGEVRAQFHHVIDIAATVLDAAGLPEPTTVHGVEQMPLHGVSMTYSFDDASAAERRTTQYFEMFCNRGIYHEGWTAVTRHSIPWMATEMPAFADDVWELYGPDDWTQAHDLADRAAGQARRAPAPLPGRGEEVQRAAAGRPSLRAVQPRPRRTPAARPRHVPAPVRPDGPPVRELDPVAEEQVARDHGRDRGAGERRERRHPVAGRRVRRLRALREGRETGVLLQPLRSPALQGLRRGARFLRASTRCAWSSPTTAAGSARAVPSRSSSTASRSARVASRRPCRCSSPRTRRPTSGATPRRR